MGNCGSGVERRSHSPSRGQQEKWEWLKVKYKSRKMWHIWRLTSGTSGEAQGRSEESPTVPAQQPTMLVLLLHRQHTSTVTLSHGAQRTARQSPVHLRGAQPSVSLVSTLHVRDREGRPDARFWDWKCLSSFPVLTGATVCSEMSPGFNNTF